MPSESDRGPLRDILFHIDLAEHFTSGMELPEFVADLRTNYAVTSLEIISEASRRLSDALKTHPTIAWKNMAGARNIYRHEYEDIDAYLLLDTVKIHLPRLRFVAETELKPTPDQRGPR